MIFRSAEERGSHRQKLAGQQRKSICDNCLHGHKQECDYDDCCCICNELQSVPVRDHSFLRMRQSERYRRNVLIRARRAQGEKIIVLSQRFGLTTHTIGKICKQASAQ